MKKIMFLLITITCMLQFCTSSKKSIGTTKAATAAVHVPVTYIPNVKEMIATNYSPSHIPPRGFKKAPDSYASAKESIDDITRRINTQPDERGFMPFPSKIKQQYYPRFCTMENRWINGEINKAFVFLHSKNNT